MLYQWSSKRIDKNLLCKAVELFFESRGFKVKREEIRNEFRITAVRRANVGSHIVMVRIFGSNCDLFIEFKPLEDIRSATLLGPLVYLTGFGGFAIRIIKKVDFYKKLEDEFWEYVEKWIAEMDKFEASK